MRRRRCWRWTSADKARYVTAFHRSGKTVAAFCEAMDLSPTTFATWLRDARRTASKPTRVASVPAVTFARVACAPSALRSREGPSERADAIRLVVRGAAGHEAALDCVDPTTALQIVALLLERPR